MIPLDRVREMLAAATPGPWCVEGGTMGGLGFVVAGEFQVATAAGQAAKHDPAGRDHVGVRNANSALIAAAPDLARDVLALTAALATARADAMREAADIVDGDSDSELASVLARRLCERAAVIERGAR